jgi:nucleotide-binding universal stress UspA family protein
VRWAGDRIAVAAEQGEPYTSDLKEDLMKGSIICGIDDSESAKGAERVARGLSARLGLPLVFVRVVEDGTSDDKVSAIAARLQSLAANATEVDSGALWLVDVGHPADRLVAAAEDEHASLIVVGSTGPRSSLLGSVSADVSRRAPCPVVVVAPGADQSLTNGHGEARAKTGFPGLFDDGYTGVTGGIRLRPEGRGEKDGGRDDHHPSDLSGGIVRFNLGGKS